MERDDDVTQASILKTNFNSHAHVERDMADAAKVDCLINFNSHAHVERDLLDNMVYYNHRHFNSHAHVERDIVAKFGVFKDKISTHTLTWSVTAST